jgi:hypothetical protein
MKKTKTFLMAGGLGNQLFIFTAAMYYSLQNKENVIFDVSSRINALPPHGGDIRSLNPDIVFRNRPFLWRIKSSLSVIAKRELFSVYLSPKVGYDSSLEQHVVEKQIFGYFQTHKYLDDPNIRDLVDKFYIDSPSAWFSTHSSEMLRIPTISVHIRRGDYVKLRNSFGILAGDYYESAINLVLERSTNKYSRVLVFSDDVVEAKKIFSHLKVPLPVQFADPPENYPEETLTLMSLSQALVMSNSSFSWWAAQLGNASKFVVCPSQWFRNMSDPEVLVPHEWYRQQSQWEI